MDHQLGFRQEVSASLTAQSTDRVSVKGFFRRVIAVSMSVVLVVAGVVTTTSSPSFAVTSLGNPDADFNANLPNINGQLVTDIVSDGTGYLIVGSFTTADGAPRDGVFRVNLDGTPDTAFNSNLPAIGVTPSNYVRAAAWDGLGYLIGGDFNNFDSPLFKVGADGNLDTAFNNALPGIIPGVNGGVRDIEYTYGDFLVVGDYTTNAVGAKNRIMKIGNNGAPVSAFNANLPTVGMSGPLAVAADGLGYVVGGGEMSGTPKKRLFKIGSDGTPDATFNNALPEITSGAVWSITSHNDRFLVTGNFVAAGDIPTGLFAVDKTGAMDTAFNANAPTLPAGAVVNSSVWDGSGYLIGGGFTSGAPHDRLFRLTSDGKPDVEYNKDLPTLTAGNVFTLVASSAGYLLGGNFLASGEGTKNRLMGILGPPDISFSPNPGAFGTVEVKQPKSITITATNASSAAITPTSVDVSGPGVTRTATTCLSSIAIGATCTITVKWAPMAKGALTNAKVTVHYPTSKSASVELTGTATENGGGGAKKPGAVTKLKASGGPSSAKRVISWAKSKNATKDTRYTVTVKLRNKKILIKRTAGLKVTLTRKQLLKATFRTRGEKTGTLKYTVTVTPYTGKLVGPSKSITMRVRA